MAEDPAPLGNAEVRRALKAQVEASAATSNAILDVMYDCLKSILNRLSALLVQEGYDVNPTELWKKIATEDSTSVTLIKGCASISKIVMHEHKQLAPILAALIQETVDIYDPPSTGVLIGPPTALPSVIHVHANKAMFFPGGPDANVCQVPIDLSCTSGDQFSTVQQTHKDPVYQTYARKKAAAAMNKTAAAPETETQPK